MNLETIKNYYLKNAFDETQVTILRQKNLAIESATQDTKEYSLLDDDFVRDQFTTTVSQDLKANWEAAFSFLPFKKTGGIFKVTYEKDAQTNRV